MIPVNYSFGSFVAELGYVGQLAYNNAQEKGFHDNPVGDGTRIALIHSELSELLDGLRNGNPTSEHIPEYTTAEEEAADVLIRLMDLCHLKGWKLGGAVESKMRYNQTRPHKHGGKRF